VSAGAQRVTSTGFLLLVVARGAAWLHRHIVRGLDVVHVEADGLHLFVGARQKDLRPEHPSGFGEQWIWRERDAQVAGVFAGPVPFDDTEALIGYKCQNDVRNVGRGVSDFENTSPNALVSLFSMPKRPPKRSARRLSMRKQHAKRSAKAVEHVKTACQTFGEGG
jgi:hypothetical protein